MKIALYVPSLNGGGAERIMVQLANLFSAQGHSVDLVLAKAEGPYRSLVSSAVRVVDLKCSRVAWSIFPLARYLRRECPDSMLSALGYANLAAICAKLVSRRNVRLVVAEHSTLSASNKTVKKLRVRMMPWIMRIAYPFADKVVTVSDGVAKDLIYTLGLESGTVETIYNPLDVDEIARLSRLPVENLKQESGKALILAVGRLNAAKDFQTLIRAFSLLQTKVSSQLVILGEGELRGELELLVQELGLVGHVQLLGFVDNPFAWMRRANVFVLSSAWEGLPGTLLEAMACGTRVVSTDCPSGPSEILEAGRWGRLVPVGRPDELAEAIAAALHDNSPPDVSARARQFSPERAMSLYLKALGANVMSE